MSQLKNLFRAYKANLARAVVEGEPEEFNRKFAGCDPDLLRLAIDVYFEATPAYPTLPGLQAVYRDRQHRAVDFTKAPPCAFCRGGGVLPLISREGASASPVLRYGAGCPDCDRGQMWGRRYPTRERLPYFVEFAGSEFNGLPNGYASFVHEKHTALFKEWRHEQEAPK